MFAHSASSALRHASGTGTLCCASKSKAISRTTCAIGEISLTGQVRPVPRLEYRLREAARLGLSGSNLQPGFSLSGLGALAQAALTCDRVVQF